ncbi:disease resistance protein L6-like [Syzygium oleosum]|uniref:disease resistance protein L6-like n=1 Tax=Syzygium oleosum TaxID=219896 RepID=UPI0024B8DF03|nr:disease resistance protein L6-like [Syzygium oleosum]
MERRDSSNRITASTPDRDDIELLGAEFEVFLNFRGPDTRLNFADCFYHSMDGAGIRVFRDDEEIRKSEAIGDELERVIKSSTICMPIFSRNYASNPNDVQLKTGLYHDALQKHEQKFGCDVVRQWKEALRVVAHTEGWDLKDRAQVEHIRLIVAEVLIKLNKRDKNMPEHLVRIQDRVEDAMRLLEEGYPDVRYLVIHGMRGIGKTTLAKGLTKLKGDSMMRKSSLFLMT